VSKLSRAVKWIEQRGQKLDDLHASTKVSGAPPVTLMPARNLRADAGARALTYYAMGHRLRVQGDLALHLSRRTAADIEVDNSRLLGD
jgi:hypothetical protein